MSPTSDWRARVETALAVAERSGLPEAELAYWRHRLDPAQRDICSCRASLWALGGAFALSALIQVAFGFGWAWTALCLFVAVASSALTKVIHGTRAEARLRADVAALLSSLNRPALAQGAAAIPPTTQLQRPSSTASVHPT